MKEKRDKEYIGGLVQDASMLDMSQHNDIGMLTAELTN
jgi:hypothetical protein